MSINIRKPLLAIRKKAFHIKMPYKKNGKHLFMVFDWLSVIGIGSGIITGIAGILTGVGVLELSWWAKPFLFGWGAVVLLIIYYNAFPKKWKEMDEYEKAAYVMYNGVKNLTEEQIEEYFSIREKLNKNGGRYKIDID